MNALGNALEQRLFVHLIRDLVDDDGLTLAFVDVFKVTLGAHDHTATAGAITLSHTLNAINDAGSGEVGRRNDFHDFVDAGLRVVEQVQTGVDHFVEVVRRNVGGHAHRNTPRTVDQQVGYACGQHQRLAFRAVVVGAKVDGFFVDIGQHFVRDFRHANFGVSHGSGVVAVDRAEVTLTIDQHVAQRKILGHADNGVVHRNVAVRVVFTDHVTHNTRRFFVGAIPVIVELVHGVQHTTMHGFETVAGVGQGASHDHAHGVIQIAAAHLLFEADGQGFLGKWNHERSEV